jgi:hypothetical protein
MHLAPALMLSTSGLVVAAAAFLNRGDRVWQRNAPWIMGVAVAQVALGVIALIVIR